MRKKQIEESRKLILDGFFTILENKPYNEISMSEIAEKSMVTRMTLYRHFKSKDEILKYLIMNIVASIKEKYSKVEEKSIGKLIEMRNQEISANMYLKAVLSNKEAEHIVREFVAYGRTLFQEYLELSPYINEYKRSFIIGGIESITTRWILGGMKESCKLVTDETLKVLSLFNRKGENLL